MKNLRKQMKKKCDILFSQIIRTAGKCYRCGATTGLQCAHIMSRRYYNTRWDLDNAVCLCNGCHVWFTHHPNKWQEFITSRFGKSQWGNLEHRKLQYGKVDYDDVYRRLGGTL